MLSKEQLAEKIERLVRDAYFEGQDRRAAWLDSKARKRMKGLLPALLAHIEELEGEKEESATYLKGRVTVIEGEKDSIQRAYHNLISPGADFYSWQRDWQNIARVLLGLPMDCDMDELRLALALRSVEVPE